MNYIYDIVLNFNRDYFEFFEWKKGDKIFNIKKIPAFKISSSDLRDLKYNIVKISKDFIDKIYGLTSFYSKFECKYLCLVSDTNETIGLMFDKDGNLVKRSSLIFDECEEVNEEIINENEISFVYIKNDFRKIEYISRSEKEKRAYLLKFINALDLNRDKHILRYIYYDYFEKEEEDISLINKILIKEINNEEGNNYQLYNIVKVFKKIKN